MGDSFCGTRAFRLLGASPITGETVQVYTILCLEWLVCVSVSPSKNIGVLPKNCRKEDVTYYSYDCAAPRKRQSRRIRHDV